VKILIADDDHASRLVAGFALRDLGHECLVVEDGLQAWGAFQSFKPDVVISDRKMPGMDGMELCEKIRAHERGHSTYFIMVTGLESSAQIIEGMEAGADDYLLKPLLPETLQLRLISASRVTSLHAQLTRQRLELQDLNETLNTVSSRDPLTGLGNRRMLDEDLEVLGARVERYGHRYSIAILDVDHFKAYNDTYGHQAGDEVLRAVGAVIKQQARGGDGTYRYGGEEFLCIFPEQSKLTAAIAVERIRSTIEALGIPHIGSPNGMLTLSAGVAVMESARKRPIDEVLKDADTALYEAKRVGRNRVELAPVTVRTLSLAEANTAGV
jgi:diguanylate cyclase (GGDEF)-like protein